MESKWLKRLATVIVLAALLLGGGLRFYELGHDGLWSDELFTTSMVTHHSVSAWAFERINVGDIQPGDSFWKAKGGEQSPPLFELLTKASVTLFGASEFSLRFVSAIAGCLWLVFAALRSFRAQDPRVRRAYRFALVFGAVSPVLVAYAQECRAYALGTFLCGVVAALWLERWFDDAPSFPRWGEVLVLILACHTHYNALVFVALLLTSYGVQTLRQRRWHDLARLAVVPLACVPWVALNAHTIVYTARGSVRWSNLNYGESFVGTLSGVLENLSVPFASVCAIGLIVLVAQKRFAFRRGLLALLILSIAYVTLIAYVTMRAGMLNPRYTLFLLPVLHVGAGLVLSEAFSRTSLAAVVVGAVTLTSVGPLRSYYETEREGYREVTAWLRSKTSENANIVYVFESALSVHRYYLQHYFGENADRRALGFTDKAQAEKVCAALGDHPVAVIGHATLRPLFAELAAACRDRFSVVEETEVRNVVGQVLAPVNRDTK